MSDSETAGRERGGGVELMTLADESSFQGPARDDAGAVAGQGDDDVKQQQQQQQQGNAPQQPRTHIAIAEAPENDTSRASVVSIQVHGFKRAPRDHRCQLRVQERRRL